MQTHAADHLVGVGGGEQVGQARGLEGSRIGGLRVELSAQLFHLFRGDRRTVIAPAAAHETEDFGDFPIQ
ncbi:hypothetical protein D3C72_2475180 [compost metagenome]